MSQILIACGGTGGHLAPGIAVAEALQAKGHSCRLLISNKQVDSALIEKYPHLTFLKAPGRAFSGGILARVGSLWTLLCSFRFACKVVRQYEPNAVLLFGGFLSVGLGVAARLSGVLVALHEANCAPGKSIRLIKRLANRIYLPDGVRLCNVPPNIIRYYGYPVRNDIKHSLKVDSWKRLGIAVPNKLLVIIGGSQGAAALNTWAMESFSVMARLGVTVYCVTGLGKSTCSTISQVDIRGNEITATLVPFSDNMGDVISAADLVISRAGAGSIAEIIRCRAPAILIPYPHAADDHQYANARMHEQHGAGIVISEAHLDRLNDEVLSLIFNDWMLAKFKSNLTRLDRFDSCQRIAADIEQLCIPRTMQGTGRLESVV
ncbi:MAG: UDP-N-acetylglucosamine--N-acetylmuramyl-(pentapeptide) pyrophosphoryl-undecaprenol N-acetylglucosamine transferase [Lentimonas sp.]|jgi:UDP-N-acetylglucosamine--N-acetylmuramyl-(pentapeptide) pyrophosphoryl-undecaprenol N-acetylglucosamine transferase